MENGIRGLSAPDWAAYYGRMHKATFQAIANASGNMKGASWTRIARVLGCANQFVASNLEYWMAGKDHCADCEDAKPVIDEYFCMHCDYDTGRRD